MSLSIRQTAVLGLAAFLATGCASPDRNRSTGTLVAVTSGTRTTNLGADRFVPLAAPPETGGQCTAPPLEAISPGEGFIVLAFPDTVRPVRRIALRFAPGGKLSDYNDERGDLLTQRLVGADGGPPRPGEEIRIVPPQGRRTRISINLAMGIGMAMNDGGGQPAEGMHGTAAELMAMPLLGNPASVVERTVRRCPIVRGE